MDDIETNDPKTDPKTLKALVRRKRRRDEALRYYRRNRARLNTQRRKRYAQDRELLRALEESLEE